MCSIIDMKRVHDFCHINDPQTAKMKNFFSRFGPQSHQLIFLCKRNSYFYIYVQKSKPFQEIVIFLYKFKVSSRKFGSTSLQESQYASTTTCQNPRNGYINIQGLLAMKPDEVLFHSLIDINQGIQNLDFSLFNSLELSHLFTDTTSGLTFIYLVSYLSCLLLGPISCYP